VSQLYRVRLRFRSEKRLNLATCKHEITIEDRRCVLTADLDGVAIKDSNWLVINARDFFDGEEATAFGQRLKAAIDLSSVATRLGVDTGVNSTTSSVSEIIRMQVEDQQDVLLRNNIHGLDVFPDDERVRIIRFSGTGTVTKDPSPFLDDLERLMGQASALSKTSSDIVLLLNYALLRRDPVAQIVFAFSAVEMVGQMNGWNEPQRKILAHLAAEALRLETGTIAEREAVSNAILSSVHQKTLRKGVLELLNSVGLNHLKKDWENLYKERSRLVHGLAPMPGVDYGELAFRVISLCGTILLSAIAKEVPLAASHVEKFYQTEPKSVIRKVPVPFTKPT